MIRIVDSQEGYTKRITYDCKYCNVFTHEEEKMQEHVKDNHGRDLPYYEVEG